MMSGSLKLTLQGSCYLCEGLSKSVENKMWTTKYNRRRLRSDYIDPSKY